MLHAWFVAVVAIVVVVVVAAAAAAVVAAAVVVAAVVAVVGLGPALELVLELAPGLEPAPGLVAVELEPAPAELAASEIRKMVTTCRITAINCYKILITLLFIYTYMYIY